MRNLQEVKAEMNRITIILPDNADMCDAATLVGVLSDGAAKTEQSDFLARLGDMEVRAEVDGDVFVTTL